MGKYMQRGSYFVPTSLLNRGRVLFRLLCLCLLFILENSEMEHVCLFLSIAAQSLNLRIFPPNVLEIGGTGVGFPLHKPRIQLTLVSASILGTLICFDDSLFQPTKTG